MVGVAGKSRACHDCRKRRVKCDYQKPTCGRCDRAGRSCPGYDKTSLFVNRTLAKPSTTAPTAIAEAKLRKIQKVVKPASRLFQVFQELRLAISDFSSSPVTTRLRAWEILKHLYLPRAEPTHDIDLAATSCYSWVHAVCHLSLESNILDRSLLAFCAIQIHIAEPQSISREYALYLYSEGVQELIQDLEFPHERDKDETLGAILALSTCELFILPNDDSWKAHAHGISELLRSRTHFEDRSIVWRRLCSRLRLICVIIALTKGQSLGIEPRIWRQLLPVDDEIKSLETLMDVVIEVPRLLEKTDELIRTGLMDQEHFQNLLTAFKKMQTWQQWCKLSSDTPLYWAVPSRSTNPADDNFETQLFPFALEYGCLNIAMLFIFSSAVMLQILSAAFSLNAINANEQLKTPPYDDFQDDISATTNFDVQEDHDEIWSSLRIRNEADKIARFMCQSTEFCFRQEMGTVGTQAMCHPTFAMRDYFRQVGQARELEWCQNIRNMRGAGIRTGVQMMLFGDDTNFEPQQATPESIYEGRLPIGI